MNDFLRNYLDTPVERRNTACIKWDKVDAIYNSKDLIPAWVADMDFPTAPAVVEAVKERALHPIYGYTDNRTAEVEAEMGWLKRRHNLETKPEWFLYSPGVVDSLYFCVRALTEVGDKVVIQTPVYGPFYKAVQTSDRELVANPLIETEDGWKMDLAGLENCFKDGAKLILICNPHNPLGRLWTREELQAVVDLANRYGVTVVSDEIHADFSFDGRKTVRLLSLDNAEGHIMLTSATKSFNIAGLRHSACIIPDQAKREKVNAMFVYSHADMANIFGSVATVAAYTHGDEWMDAVCEYVAENRDYVVEALGKALPEVKVRPQEGTYLMWLDFSAFGPDHETIKRKLLDEAHVALNCGLDFGEGGSRHFRFNLAAPRCIIKTVTEAIIAVFRRS
ncbi:MAG: pyridoxal phosphate-dependent aminotransferase [Clostridia bacterium]|nr:pyridoxal phosphate-dependent aminotransferase [Clostridia bacterium]